MAEMREATRARLLEWGWPEKYYRDELPHKACPSVPKGAWKVMSYGEYERADYIFCRYVSYRCPKCGWMVQVNQPFSISNNEAGEITILEVMP